MKTTFRIPGMHCVSCATLIKDVSSEFKQIQNINVDINTKCVEIDHSDDFDIAKWTAEVEALGDAYRVVKVS